MIGALLKKQFLELGYIFTGKKNKKIGKRNNGFAIGLGAFIYLVFFGTFFALSFLFMEGLKGAPDGGAIYFSILGIIAVFVGVIGSVFTTYNMLYLAKDNEQLLSLPIKPSAILFTRITVVFITSFVYSSSVFLPSVICYWINGFTSIFNIINPIIALFIVGIKVTTLTCIFGFIIALIAVRVKKKTFISVLVAIILIGVYYFVYAKMSSYITLLAENATNVGSWIETYVYPAYTLGEGARGDLVSLIIALGIYGGAFAVCYFILSKTFILLTTIKVSDKKKVYVGKEEKTRKVGKALLHREAKKFFSSVAYLLNVGIGALFMVFGAVVVLIYGNDLSTVLGAIPSPFNAFIPVVIGLLVNMISSMTAYTPPSISIEGKSFWIVRTLPVKTIDILVAKEKMHYLIAVIPSVILCVAFCVALKIDVVISVLLVLSVIIYIMFSANLGLTMAIKKPNFDWTNETTAVKSGLPVVVAILGGWGINVILFGISLLLVPFITVYGYFAFNAVAFFVGYLLLHNWIKNKGVLLVEKM